jgi:pimeloyl-ACP methyl ester carboxylesterase/predicted glycosyltransferase
VGEVRARYPDRDGYVERDGVKLFYEVFGSGEPTVMLLPTWSIIHSRFWKMQVPYLARHYRVVTFDPRGNGRSDRPVGPEAYAEHEFADDAIAVMDATGTERAVLVSLSMGAHRALLAADRHPERVEANVLIAPSLALEDPPPTPEGEVWFDRELDTYEGWEKYNRHSWVRDFRGFLEFFFSQMFTEPHSTKQIEDAVGWALEMTPETLIDASLGEVIDVGPVRAAVGRVRHPTLVIHGADDHITGVRHGVALAEAMPGSDLVLLEGAGHNAPARDPVKVNLLLRDFIDRVHPPKPASSGRRWVRGRSRRKRALFISSPIGLGHTRRDAAIAAELHRLHPDLEIDWLAQEPVTTVLREAGERIHPASAELSSEVEHIDSESAEHDLHVFQAWRRMDEILLANFMVFHDVIEREDYDLWIGDEAWELDYYLHENPERKRAAYAWLTDFVGWLPMPDGGDREVALTADYNAEMIEHIARFPRVRDRAIFVGGTQDIVPDAFGPGLPGIREWTEQHYRFTGDYITGLDPAVVADREALRERLGYRSDERVCMVTVGGSGVGRDLLRRVCQAAPAARRLIPGLRMVVVAGPRIDPDSLPHAEGLDVRPYVPDLHLHLAACDVAVVQGGLTTTMELTAAGRPFLYFPLRHHFEQNFHVRHRLDQHGAGRRMDYGAADPDAIAEAMAEEIGRQVAYRSVDPEAAARAARDIAELI